MRFLGCLKQELSGRDILMRRVLAGTAAGLLTVLVLAGAPAHAETLSGAVVDAGGKPIPGLTVFLVHPKAGRSSPSVTDSLGRFLFSSVPAIPDDYYLEVYWGDRLVYRRLVPVHGNVRLEPIVLK